MMKKYMLIFIAIFILIAGVSAVLASISLPPPEPKNDPPGPSISHEQVLKMQRCQEWFDNYVRENCDRYYTGVGWIDPECRKRAVRILNECLDGIMNPPQLILPK